MRELTETETDSAGTHLDQREIEKRELRCSHVDESTRLAWTVSELELELEGARESVRCQEEANGPLTTKFMQDTTSQQDWSCIVGLEGPFRWVTCVWLQGCGSGGLQHTRGVVCTSHKQTQSTNAE